MADFTPAHFKLLNKWKNQKRDKSNPEQNSAYEELERAYEVTETWAQRLKQELLPQGRVDVRKRPTNQANNFAAYNWARIYPSLDSPKELAYTVGIAADVGFVVKIDTVGISDFEAVRKAYFALRGPYDNGSPIVAMLPAQEGLSKNLNELVDWSAESIRGFKMRYDEVAAKLGLDIKLDDAAVLARFDGNPEFERARSRWSAEVTASFCRLVRAVHDVGLDWWHTEIKGPQIRFGRKQPELKRATAVLGYVYCGKSVLFRVNQGVEGLQARDWTEFGEGEIAKVVGSLEAARDAVEDWKPVSAERAGFWPDQLQSEAGDPSDPEVEPSGLGQNSSDVKQKNQSASFNRIYYGPPGTGKTHKLGELLKKDYEEVSSVSTNEWRAQFIAERISGLTWWEGAAAALKDLGGRAKVSEFFEHPFIQAISAAKGRNQNVRQTLWGTLQSHAVEDSTTVKTKQRLGPAVFDKGEDSVWRFAGEWQEACADLLTLVEKYQAGPEASDRIKRHSFVTFHQSFGYEEFVEGLRPVLGGDEASGEVKYEIRAGVFKDLCRRAKLAPDQRFAMVIDEINRGNISKIFGELITLIELDKREGAEYAAAVMLPYSGESFSVPCNVDIIGAMNTADRSLALLDTALRRRFDFEALLPDARDVPGAPLHNVLVTLGDKVIDVPKLLAAINERIEALYDRDHAIGHAYFMSLGKVADGQERMDKLAEVFRRRIVPLLEEYFFEDWRKIQLVLGDNQGHKSSKFIAERADKEDDLYRLFGSNHGLDSYATKHRYAIQESAFEDPDSYIGIYTTLSG